MISRLVIPALLASACTLAFADYDQDDEIARQALAARQYSRVVEAYKPYADPLSGTGLSARAHYRLAIAHHALGDPIQAWLNLQEALHLDPDGAFASTATRLDQIAAAIKTACAQSGAPDCVSVSPAASLPVQVTASEPAAPLAPAPSAAPVARETTKPPPQPTPVGAQSSPAGRSTDRWVVLLGVLPILAGVAAFILFKRGRARRKPAQASGATPQVAVQSKPSRSWLRSSRAALSASSDAEEIERAFREKLARQLGQR